MRPDNLQEASPMPVRFERRIVTVQLNRMGSLGGVSIKILPWFVARLPQRRKASHRSNRNG